MIHPVRDSLLVACHIPTVLPVRQFVKFLLGSLALFR